MENVNEDLIVYAFRYALGRKTYAVSQVSDYLIDNWHRLSKYTQSQICEEIEEAINKNEAGMDCDIFNWKRILLLNECIRG